MGPSGCGKSTLLNLVGGLDIADDGEVLVAEDRSSAWTENQLALMRRRHVGIVFQFFNLLEGIARSRTSCCRRRSPAVRAAPPSPCPRPTRSPRPRGQAAERLELLSGGQRQRLAIARALANEPTIVLADEPTGALDSEGGEEVLELFRRLHQGGQTILLVTHDQPVADAAERIVRMKDGRVVDDGTMPVIA